MRKALWSLSGILLVLPFAGCDLEERVPAQVVSITKSQPLGAEKALDVDIRFDVGSLEIAADKGASTYTVDLDYDKASYQEAIGYEESGGTGRLTFRLESLHKLGLRSDRHPNRLRLGLTNTLPVRLAINNGVGDARLSLTGLLLTNLDLESGVGSARISSYEPNQVSCDRIRIKNGVGSLDAVGLGYLRFSDLEFEGGVGGANLDFSGEWQRDAEIKIQVGVGGVSVKMPRGIGVKVEGHKNFLSGFHLDGFTMRDSFYYSEGYDEAKIRASVRVVTGVGGFKITWL
jgi:hypothetical protein